MLAKLQPQHKIFSLKFSTEKFPKIVQNYSVSSMLDSLSFRVFPGLVANDIYHNMLLLQPCQVIRVRSVVLGIVHVAQL